MELKTILQWNDDSTGSQCKATFSTSHSILPSLSSLDLIACVEGALCKTRDVIHLQPSCVSTNCPGLSLLYCSQSITNLLWGAGQLFLQLFFLFAFPKEMCHCICWFWPWDIKAIYIPLGYPQALMAFGEIQKSLESVRSNTNNHGKNKRELLNTTTLPGNVNARSWNDHSNPIFFFFLMHLISLSS